MRGGCHGSGSHGGGARHAVDARAAGQQALNQAVLALGQGCGGLRSGHRRGVSSSHAEAGPRPRTSWATVPGPVLMTLAGRVILVQQRLQTDARGPASDGAVEQELAGGAAVAQSSSCAAAATHARAHAGFASLLFGGPRGRPEEAHDLAGEVGGLVSRGTGRRRRRVGLLGRQHVPVRVPVPVTAAARRGHVQRRRARSSSSRGRIRPNGCGSGSRSRKVVCWTLLRATSLSLLLLLLLSLPLLLVRMLAVCSFLFLLMRCRCRC